MTTDGVLPLPDFDELPIAKLRHQIRSLSTGELQTLIEHEHEHGNRTPVLVLLQTRKDELAGGAEPSGGDQWDGTGKPSDTPHGSRVSRAGAAQPSGPLRHGVAGQTPNRDTP